VNHYEREEDRAVKEQTKKENNGRSEDILCPGEKSIHF
jgi:hypothetical protein